MKKNLKIMEASGSDVPRVAHFLVERFHKEYEDWYPPVDVERYIAYIGDHWEHGKAASMLVDALKTLAETLDLDLMLSTNTGSRLKAKERFFESKGLHRIGTMHVLRK